MTEDFVSTYGWWILGFVLLGLELVLPGVYLIFFGFAALVVAANTFFLGAGWFDLPQQLIAFVAVSAISIFVGNRWYGAERKSAETGDDDYTLRLVGRDARVTEAIEAGRGRVALGDSWWTVEGPNCPVGTRVRVTGASGNLLIVEPVPEDEDGAVRARVPKP